MFSTGPLDQGFWTTDRGLAIETRRQLLQLKPRDRSNAIAAISTTIFITLSMN